ncbi:MAG: lauroyl acyltransferase [Rhodobacteraceae bacterium]|nr:MAG: lauroyl acyltransferase [Paracoccaceae bacterium]
MPADPSTLSGPRRAGYFVGNLAARGLIGLMLALPYALRVRTMGWLVSRILSPLAGFDRRIRDNLALACPDLPEAEVRRLCRAVPDNAGRTLIEIYSGKDFQARANAHPPQGPGVAALTQARDEGRPVLLVGGHLGNYDAMRANLVPRGFPMGAIYRRMANPYFNAHYVRAMETNGTPLFEQGRRGMIEMVKHLRAGGMVAILTDLHVQDGAALTFFGQPCATSTVTAELALKYGALIIPFHAIRDPNGLDFTLHLNAPIPHGDPLTMSQAINDDLEAMVRRHMDQWFWIHRRWKPWY